MQQNDHDSASMTSQEIHDDELEKCILELMHNSHENYSDVHAHVDASNVYFSGVLSSEAARMHLEEIAGMVQGIGLIFNEVTLKH